MNPPYLCSVDDLPTRRLGCDGPIVSAIGFGCMGLSQGYGGLDRDHAVAVVRHAIDNGITLLDTAMSYGAGDNERLVGKAIAGRRDDVVLASKFGIVRNADGVGLDARPDHVRQFCEASVQRLGTDRLDLYYLHRVDPDVPVEESIGAMAELVVEGKVQFIGVSEVDGPTLERAVATHPISALESEWSLFWRELEDDVIPTARRVGVAIVPYSPLGRGLLSGGIESRATFGAGDFRAGDDRFAGETLDANLALVDVVRSLAADLGATPGQLALAWLLAQGDDVVPIPGTRNPDHVDENVAATTIELSANDLARFDKVVPRGAWVGDRRSFAAYGTRRSARSGSC